MCFWNYLNKFKLHILLKLCYFSFIILVLLTHLLLYYLQFLFALSIIFSVMFANLTKIDRDSKDKDKDKAGNNQLAVPRLSVCADAQKVDRAKLAQTEFNIIEFDPDTFRVLLDYLHTGTCPLTCVSIPGEQVSLLIIFLFYTILNFYQDCFALQSIMIFPNCYRHVFITVNNFCALRSFVPC